MCPDPDERGRARKLAMDLLARREHSRLELARKLAARDFARELIDGVLAQLEKDNLLSEQRFAEAFVRSRISSAKGPVRIIAELRERGLSDQMIRSAIDLAQADWSELAATALHKRFGTGAAKDIRERAKRVRFLSQRGFSAEQVQHAMKYSDEE